MGAKPGDRLYVSGTIGDAYLGLRLLREPALAETWGLTEEDVAFLVERYRRPGPNSELALLVRNFAQAAIDVSDGLVGDIEKLCRVSHVGARIEAGARAVLARGQEVAGARAGPSSGSDRRRRRLWGRGRGIREERGGLRIGGGSLMARRSRMIGEVLTGGGGVTVLDGEGHPIELKHKGFSHF